MFYTHYSTVYIRNISTQTNTSYKFHKDPLHFLRQLSQKRTFTSASAHCPAVNSLSGLTSLDQFQEVDKLDAYTEELKKCGLTDEDIQLKMMADDSNKV